MRVKTVGDLKKHLADVDDDIEVMVVRDKVTRFHQAEVAEVEIDISERNADGYLQADVFTRSLHRRKVIAIL